MRTTLILAMALFLLVPVPVTAAPPGRAPSDTEPPRLVRLQPETGSILPSTAIELSGGANEPLASVRVNGLALRLSGDRRSFSGTWTAPSPGSVTLHWGASDLAGNPVAFDTVVVVAPKPVITVGAQDHLLTREAAFVLPVTVVSGLPGSTTVWLNGLSVFSSPLSSFQYTVTLVEGLNRIEVRSVNSKRQEGAPVSLSDLTLDSKAPVISGLPDVAQPVAAGDGAHWPLTVTVTDASQTTTRVFLSGQQVFETTQAAFSAPLALATGENAVRIESRDAAGNSSEREISVRLAAAQPPAPVLGTTVVDHHLTALPQLAVPVTVTSLTSTETRVLVNDGVIHVSSEKVFTAHVPLAAGLNRIEIRSVDSFGASAAPILFTDIVYNPPASLTGMPGNTASSPAFSFPTQLSAALKDELSVTTTLLALATSRTDPIACEHGLALTPPVDLTPSLANIDSLTQITPAIQSLADRLGSTEAIYFFVRDRIRFIPRFGGTQTVAQTLESGMGTAVDKASVLIALLRARGIPARYLAGDLFVDEGHLKSLYGVEAAQDLAWAQVTTLRGYFQHLYPASFDAVQMVRYVNGRRAWQIPHVWVHAFVPGAEGQEPQWLQLDPTSVAMEYENTRPGLPFPSESSITTSVAFLFSPDSSGRYVKPGNLADTLYPQIQGYGLGFQEIGISVLDQAVVLPVGSIAVAAPCLRAQADLLPDEYWFRSYFRVGEPNDPTLQGSLPLAVARGETLSIASENDKLVLRSGENLISESDGLPPIQFDLFHSIQEPLAYGGTLESRVTPGLSSTGMTVVSHSIGGVSEDQYVADTKRVVEQAHPSQSEFSPRQKVKNYLKQAASLAVIQGRENERVINRFRNLSHVTESLLVTSSQLAIPVERPHAAGFVAGPTDAQMDWHLAGPSYSRSGGYDDFMSYQNIGDAKGELVVANSSLEHQVWEALFSAGKAVSTVKAIQTAVKLMMHPEAGGTMPVSTQLINGQMMNFETADSLFAAFGTAMQAQIPYLRQFLGESPYLLGVSESIPVAAEWNGVAYLIMPSNPMGQAGAFISTTGGAPILGGNYFEHNCTVTVATNTNYGQKCIKNEGSFVPSADGSSFKFGETHETSSFSISCTSLDPDSPGCLGPNLLPIAMSAGTRSSDHQYYSIFCDVGWLNGGYCVACQMQNRDVVSWVMTDVTSSTNTGDSSCQDWHVSPGTQSIVIPPGVLAMLPPGAPPIEIPVLSPPILLDPTYNPPVLQPQADNLSSPFPGIGPFGTPTNTEGAKGQCAYGDPVNTATGSMWQTAIDFDLPGRTASTGLKFVRTHTSQSTARSEDLGPGWRHNWESRLYLAPPSLDPTFGELEVPGFVWIDEKGGAWVFRRLDAFNLVSPPGLGATLRIYDDRYELTQANAMRLIYHRVGNSPLTGKLKAVVEPHGDRIDLEYDEQALLRFIRSDYHGSIRFERHADGSGRISNVIRERDGLEYRFEYDSAGRLTSVTDFGGNINRYEYGEKNLLSAMVDPLGRRRSFTYYPDGRAFEQTELGGAYRAFTYGLPGNGGSFTRVRDMDGNALEFRYDQQGHIQTIIHPDGARTQSTWDAQQNPASLTDEMGYTRVLAFDSAGRPAVLYEPGKANGMLLEYDPVFGKVTRIRSIAAGSETALMIDQANGDVTQIQSTGSDSTLALSLTHDPWGNPLTVNNGRTIYAETRDENGLLLTTSDLHNPETRTYDSRHRLSTRTWASGRKQTLHYDDYDRVTGIEDTAGPSVAQIYDKIGRLLSRTISDGVTPQTTSYVWDDRDRLTQVTDPAGRVTRYQYDRVWVGCNVVDKPAVVIDPAGRRTRFEYDARQRLTRKIDANGGVTRFEYNLRGDLTALTDAGGNRTRFFYTPWGALERRERPSVAPAESGVAGEVIAVTEATYFTYDASDRLIREEKGRLDKSRRQITEYTYDSRNRVKSKTLSVRGEDGSIEVQDESTYTYQPQLDATLLATADNAVAKLKFEYDLAPPFALKAFENHAAQAGNPLGLIEDRYSITRDATGELSALQAASTGANLLESEHDLAGRLTKATGLLGAQTLQMTLTYDGYGRKSTVTSSTGLVGAYSYDLLNRPTQISWDGVAVPGGGVEHFSEALTYGAMTGNIDQVVRELGTFTYEHDKLDQLTKSIYSGAAQLPPKIVNRQLAYDFSGNRVADSLNGPGEFLANALLSNDKATYQRDAEGLGQLALKSDRANGEVQEFSYTAEGKRLRYEDAKLSAVYPRDALGRRVAKFISPKDNEPFTQSYLYLGETDQVLLAKAGDATMMLHLHGQNVNEYLGEVSSGGTKAYVTDHLGSVINSPATGGASAYSAWGETLGSAPQINRSSPAYIVGYAGMQFDLENRHYHTKYRAYLPIESLWNSKDPIGFISGDYNLYRYVSNNPVIFVDPTGLFTQNLFASLLTPVQQIEAGGVATAIGVGILRASLPIIGTPLGAVTGLLGGALIYEGGVNSLEGLNRTFKSLNTDPLGVILNMKRNQQLVCRAGQ